MRKYNNYLLILFAFSLPLKLFLINGLSVIIFLLWLLEGDLRDKWQRLKQSKIFWVLTALSLVTLLSLLWSDSLYGGYFNHRSQNGLQFWFDKFGYKFLLLPVLLTSVDKHLFKQIMSAFLAGMFLSEIASYGIFFGLWQIGRGIPEDPTPFLHHTYYSAFLILAIFVSLVRFQQTTHGWIKYFYLLFSLTATINLFLNGGRTGQLAFLFAALYFATHYYRLTRKTVLLTVATLGLLYSVAFIASPVFKQRVHDTSVTLQKMERGEFQTSIGQRIALWIAVGDILKAHPLLGAGLGSAKSAVIAMQRQKYPNRPYIVSQMSHIHNQFLQTYLDTGIIGLLLLLILFGLLFTQNFYEYTIYARIYAISLLMLCLVDVPLRFNYGIGYLLLFSGLFFGYKAYKERR